MDPDAHQWQADNNYIKHSNNIEQYKRDFRES